MNRLSSSPLPSNSIATEKCSSNSPKGKSYASSNGPSPIKCEKNSTNVLSNQTHQSSLDANATTATANSTSTTKPTTASSLSSCSNSPSSVRLNQNYDPHQVDSVLSSKSCDLMKNVKKFTTETNDSVSGNATSDTIFSTSRNDDTNNTERNQREADLDTLDDGDNKPLLEKPNSSTVANGKITITNGKRVNGKYGIRGTNNLDNVDKIDDCHDDDGDDDDDDDAGNNESETLINTSENA